MEISAVEIYRKIWNHKMQIVSFFLCLVLLFTCSIAIPFTQAQADGGVTVAAATLQELLLLIGITITVLGVGAFINYLQTHESGQSVLDWIDEIDNTPDSNGKTPNDGGNISINAASTAMLLTLAHEASEFFKDSSGTVNVVDYDTTNYSYYDSPIIIGMSNFTDEQIFSAAGISSSSITVLHDKNGLSYEFKVVINSSSVVLYCNNSVVTLAGYSNVTVAKYGFTTIIQSNVTYIVPFLALKFTYNGQELTRGFVQTSYWISGNNTNGFPVNPTEVLGVHPSTDYTYTNNPTYSPSTVIGAISDTATKNGVVTVPLDINDTDTSDDTQKQALIDIGIDPDTMTVPDIDTETATETDPDLQYKPAITELPDIGGIWDYVRNFMSNALIWMLLWFNGFNMLPIEIRYMVYGILVITIVTGLLGVFLK